MYTWGYIKECILSKLNLDEESANQQDFLSRFPYYANEAMTQICSIKPAEKRFSIEVTKDYVGKEFTMPDDFITFSDDIVYFDDGEAMVDAGDEFVIYGGYKTVHCTRAGVYSIPYRARWFFFTKELANAEVIPAPADVCEAIPSYVVSQCYKIDDELKAAIYRNEFEMFLARLDDTSFKRQRTFHIGGGW